MFKLALRDTRASALRLAMSVVAVMLGVAFIVGTLCLRNVLSTTFGDIVDSGYRAAAYVESPSGVGNLVTNTRGDQVIPIDLAQQIATFDGVGAVIPEISGQAILVGADGTAVTGGGGAPSLGFAADGADPTMTISQGVAPSTSSQVALEESTAQRAGLTVGDPTTVIANGVIHKVTVSGLVHFDANMAGATLVLLDPDTARAAFAPSGTVPYLAVYAASQNDTSTAAPGASRTLSASAEQDFVDSVRQQLEAAGLSSQDYTVASGSSVREAATAQTSEQVGFISSLLLIFAALALCVGAFVIANTFSMTIRQKQREFAMLRAVGASPFQIFTRVVVQAVLVGCVGGLLGVAGGFGLVQGLRAVFGSVGMDLAGDLALTPTIAFVGVGLGVATAALSAAFAARRAALTAPVEAMRESAAPTVRPTRLRTRVGLAAVGLGAVGLVGNIVARRIDHDFGGALPYGLSCAVLLIGALMSAPVVAPIFIRAVSMPFTHATRPMGALAAGNISRNPKRTSATAGALTVGMALVAAAAVLAASTNASVKGLVEKEMTADFIIQSATFSVSADATAQIAQLPEVGLAAAFTTGTVQFDASTGGHTVSTTGETTGGTTGGMPAVPADTQLEIGGAQPGSFTAVWSTPALAGTFDTLGQGAAIIQKSFATQHDLTVGDEITVTGHTGSRSIPVGAIFDSAALGIPLMVSTDVLNELVPAEGQTINTVMVNGADGVPQSQLRAALAKVAAPYLVLSVMDQDEFTGHLTAQIDQVLTVLYGLLALSLVIASLGIMNTLGLSVVERTREIGLLRAVGLGRGHLAGTFIIESILTALFGTVLGMVVGIAIASGLPSLLAAQGLSELIVPWQPLVYMLGLAIVVGVAAALWPARRAAHLPVLDAIAAVE